jgi:ATP-dependent DNA helicase RecQ
LLEYLRQWRRLVAKNQNTPAFVVMHDTSLEDLCRKRPGSMAELLEVAGFGKRKAEMYGHQVLAALGRFRNRLRPPAGRNPHPG